MKEYKETKFAVKCHKCTGKKADVRRLCPICDGLGMLPVYEAAPNTDTKPQEGTTDDNMSLAPVSMGRGKKRKKRGKAKGTTD